MTQQHKRTDLRVLNAERPGMHAKLVRIVDAFGRVLPIGATLTAEFGLVAAQPCA